MEGVDIKITKVSNGYVLYAADGGIYVAKAIFNDRDKLLTYIAKYCYDQIPKEDFWRVRREELLLTDHTLTPQIYKLIK